METLFTIGHSTHSLEEFIALLKSCEITQLIDVRTIPKSRRYPWFEKESLAASLLKNNIHYTHMLGLGGFRKPVANSPNMAWKNEGFRGFADYMQTSEFELNLEKLNKIIENNNHVVIMCAEALPWRCHRSLISDAEVVRNIKVIHIINLSKTQEHKLTPFAKIKKGHQVYYPDLLS